MKYEWRQRDDRAEFIGIEELPLRLRLMRFPERTDAFSTVMRAKIQVVTLTPRCIGLLDTIVHCTLSKGLNLSSKTNHDESTRRTYWFFLPT